MSLSSRHAIATHILLVLGCMPEKPVRSDLLAESVCTNPVVIRRLIGTLRDSGLVEVKHGAQGGYSLARPADRISLWDIYQAVEPDCLFALHPCEPNPDCTVGNCIQDLLGEVYGRVEAELAKQLKRVTLRKMIKEICGR